MKKLLCIVLVTLGCQLVNGQNRLSEKNSIGWFTAIVTPALSKKVSLHGEYQWRRVNFLKHWQQSLARVGVNYKIHPQVTFQVGYAYAPTFAYGTYTLAAVPKTYPEHRMYEQVVVTSSIGKANLSNRLRLEQRWLGRFSSLSAEKPDYIYLNRLRYMPRVDIPITSKFYAAASDEILIGFGKNVGENVFDQNRISALLGYKASGLFRVEAGFVNQIVQLGREIEGKNVFQYNSGLMVNTYFNF